jgi:hypothetical protein
LAWRNAANNNGQQSNQAKQEGKEINKKKRIYDEKK